MHNIEITIYVYKCKSKRWDMNKTLKLIKVKYEKNIISLWAYIKDKQLWFYFIM